MKKTFKETRIAQFLKEKAPKVLDTVGSILPDKGALGILKNIISKDSKMSEVDRQEAFRLIDQDIAEAQEVTKRWQADMVSDSWLSKNVRPIVLLSLLVFFFILTITDSVVAWQFEVNTAYIELMKVLLVTTVAAYFGSRGMEKYKKISNGSSK